MINKNFDFITDWTVSTVQFVYHLFVQNTYFVLSNSLFLLLLFFVRLSMNNFILFLVPIFFLLVSFSAQFKVINNQQDEITIRNYIKCYRQIIVNNWRTFLFYTAFIAFIVFDLRILAIAEFEVMKYPLIITSCFLLSSMFFVLMISIDPRASELSLKRKISWSLLISYRLPSVTILNVLFIIFAVFCLQNFSLAYLCFFGGAINYFVWKNLSRRFSIDLFFEQMLG